MQNVFDVIEIDGEHAQKIQRKHGVTPEEARISIFQDPDNFAERAQKADSFEGYIYRIYGRAIGKGGHYLISLVAQKEDRMGFLLTCRPMNNTEKRRYQNH